MSGRPRRRLLIIRNSWLADENAMCLTCNDDELLSVRRARRHMNDTGHEIQIQRIRMTVERLGPV
jgi:hypothetical protein